MVLLSLVQQTPTNVEKHKLLDFECWETQLSCSHCPNTHQQTFHGQSDWFKNGWSLYCNPNATITSVFMCRSLAEKMKSETKAVVGWSLGCCDVRDRVLNDVYAEDVQWNEWINTCTHACPLRIRLETPDLNICCNLTSWNRIQLEDDPD